MRYCTLETLWICVKSHNYWTSFLHWSMISTNAKNKTKWLIETCLFSQSKDYLYYTMWSGDTAIWIKNWVDSWNVLQVNLLTEVKSLIYNGKVGGTLCTKGSWIAATIEHRFLSLCHCHRHYYLLFCSEHAQEEVENVYVHNAQVMKCFQYWK